MWSTSYLQNSFIFNLRRKKSTRSNITIMLECSVYMCDTHVHCTYIVSVPWQSRTRTHAHRHTHISSYPHDAGTSVRLCVRLCVRHTHAPIHTLISAYLHRGDTRLSIFHTYRTNLIHYQRTYTYDTQHYTPPSYTPVTCVIHRGFMSLRYNHAPL